MLLLPLYYRASCYNSCYNNSCIILLYYTTMTQQQHGSRIDASDAQSGTRKDDIESYQSFYKRLAVHNDPKMNGGWADEALFTESDHDKLTDCIATKLSLTDFQTKRAKHIVGSLPDNLFRAYKNVLVVAVACAVAGHEDGRPYHPSSLQTEQRRSQGTQKTQQELATILDESGVTLHEYRSVWGRVQNVVPGKPGDS